MAEKLWITELIPDYLMSFLFGDKNTNKRKGESWISFREETKQKGIKG